MVLLVILDALSEKYKEKLVYVGFIIGALKRND